MPDGSLSLQGSAAAGFGGDGGALDVAARGQVYLAAAVPVRVGAATDYDGAGGTMRFRSGDPSAHVPGPLDGDLLLYAPIWARSGATGGFGGELTAEAGRDLTIDSTIDLGGKDGGGGVVAAAADDLSFTGKVTADATSAIGMGGAFEANACTVSVGSTARVEVPGESGGTIDLIGGNRVTVSSTSVVEAGDGGLTLLVTRTVAANNPYTGGTISQFDPAPIVFAEPTLPGCGLCAGVTCATPDECHDPGTCNPLNGVCSAPVSNGQCG
jgi:hypothetical protein